MTLRTFILSFLCIIALAMPVFAGGGQEEPSQEEESRPVVSTEEGTTIVVSEELIALVNKQPITLEDLDKETERIVAQFSSQGKVFGEEELTEIRWKILESLINRELLRQKATKMGIETDEALVEQQIEQYKAQFGGEEGLIAALSQQGYTMETFTSEITESIKLQTLITQETMALAQVTEEEAKSFYDNNPQRFVQPEMVEASHILIKMEPDADEAARKEAMDRITQIQEKLKEGVDFAEMARLLSEGPSAERGGALGFFQRGQMVKSFEDAAFALGIGEISDVTESQFGLHLINVTGKKAQRTISFEEARQQILVALQQEKSAQTINQYLDSLRKEAEVELFMAEPGKEG